MNIQNFAIDFGCDNWFIRPACERRLQRLLRRQRFIARRERLQFLRLY
jgi:hypothetical protein